MENKTETLFSLITLFIKKSCLNFSKRYFKYKYIPQRSKIDPYLTNAGAYGLSDLNRKAVVTLISIVYLRYLNVRPNY